MTENERPNLDDIISFTAAKKKQKEEQELLLMAHSEVLHATAKSFYEACKKYLETSKLPGCSIVVRVGFEGAEAELNGVTVAWPTMVPKRRMRRVK